MRRRRRSKTSSRCFRGSCGAIGSIAKRFCVIGDSVWDLLAAGRQNGPGVGLLSGGYGPQELEGAGAFRAYQDPADLLAHIEDLGIPGEWPGATQGLRAVRARSGSRAALASRCKPQALSPDASAGTLFHDESVRR